MMDTISITITEEIISAALPSAETVQVFDITEKISVAQVAEQISVTTLTEQIRPQLVTESIAVAAFDRPISQPVEIKTGITHYAEFAPVNNVAVLDCAQATAFKISCANVAVMSVLTIVLANWPPNRITEVYLLLADIPAEGIAVAWPGGGAAALQITPGVSNEYLFRSWDGINIFKTRTGFYND